MTKLHVDILIDLKAAGEFGLPLDNVVTDMRRGRHCDITEPEVRTALRDLADRTFVALCEGDLSKRWMITGRGKVALQTEHIG
jgi:hypothetical protein